MNLWNRVNQKLNLVEEIPKEQLSTDLIESWTEELGNAYDQKGLPGLETKTSEIQNSSNEELNNREAYNLGIAGMKSYLEEDIDEPVNIWIERMKKGITTRSSEDIISALEDGFDDYQILVDEGYPI